MYIKNPTQEQLDSWYKCKQKIAMFLVYKCSLSSIHRKDEYYYFVKTYQLKQALKQMSLWYKIIEKF
jgi:hypothetical protein